MSSNSSDLLHAATPEGVAFRENGLRNMEVALLAKQDWASLDEREQILTQFYAAAARLRAIDAKVVRDSQ